jgi:NUMOD4 motif/HNH endonuclease
MSDELWRPIPGYVGYYEASSLGRIRSLPRRAKNRNRIYGGAILTPSLMGNGYLGVRLSKDNVKRTHAVHELVCSAFHGEKQGRGHESEVRHKDGNPMNCRADNLCWGTHQENERDKGRVYLTHKDDWNVLTTAA